MWLSWGFGVMAENTQNVHASSLASSGKRVSCGVSSPGLWCELGSHSGPRPPAVQTEPLGHGWCLPSVFCACCFVLFPLQPGNVTLCRPGGSWFNSKEVDLAESVRMAEIPEMFKSGLLLILKGASLKWPINTVFAFVCSDQRNWTAAFLSRYNSETLQRRVNNIFLPLSGGNNENLSWKRNSEFT